TPRPSRATLLIIATSRQERPLTSAAGQAAAVDRPSRHNGRCDSSHVYRGRRTQGNSTNASMLSLLAPRPPGIARTEVLVGLVDHRRHLRLVLDLQSPVDRRQMISDRGRSKVEPLRDLLVAVTLR